jgi:hypothetical protein
MKESGHTKKTLCLPESTLLELTLLELTLLESN